MERMQGKTLKYFVEGKGMPIDTVLKLGEQITDALDTAHRAGIVHRDLKPANIFVTDRGEAKILDFGLARIQSIDPAADGPTITSDQLTSPGSMMGTVAYMAPEQVRGELVDARGDLFSLGVVLYEMATGHRPFSGPTPAMISDAILHRDVPPPSESNPSVPPALDLIICGALEKDVALRVQSAAELRSALRRLMRDQGSHSSAAGVAPVRPKRRGLLAAMTAGVVVAGLAAAWLLSTGPASPPVEKVSIAVLPFADLSQAQDQEYFSDGLSDELIGVLARNARLRVIGRTSSFQFKGKNEDLREIGGKLGVDHLLEGSVRREGDRLRITAQLVRTSDAANIWAQTYNRAIGDVLEVHDDIAGAVAQAMNVTLLGGLPVPRRAPVNVESYNLLLEGNYFRERRTRDGYEKAVAAYTRAIAADSAFASAWAGLAFVYALQAANGIIPAESGSKQARTAVQRALALDPKHPEAHSAMVYIQTGFDWDWVGADATVQRLLTLEPGSVDALFSAALSARTLGRFDEAIRYYEQAIVQDPLSPGLRNNLGLALYYAGRLSEAEAQFRKLLEMLPGFGGANCQLGKALLAHGEAEAAFATIAEESSEVWRSICLPLAYHALGRSAESDLALRELTNKFAGDWAFQIAEVYAFRGEIDQAFKWLERAYIQRDSGFSEIKGDPLLKNLEKDPRHRTWLEKLKLPV
jgi:TolB-like protein/tetratricopeptide (TPR) repeat protein